MIDQDEKQIYVLAWLVPTTPRMWGTYKATRKRMEEIRLERIADIKELLLTSPDDSLVGLTPKVEDFDILTWEQYQLLVG